MTSPEDSFEIPPIIAHRGLSSEAPENTIAAISLAAKSGLKWVEVDVKLSLDNHLLLCHDETLHRTTNGSGKVSETSWSELSKLDAGSWFHPKFKGESLPELNLVLEQCNKLNLGINLELKPLKNNIKQLTEVLIPMILEYQEKGLDILVSSFNKAIIREVVKVNKEIKVGYLVDDEDNLNTIHKFIEEIKPISIHLPDKRCSKGYIQQVKQFGKIILVYTVNKKQRALELEQMGVSLIFSDYYLL